MVYYLGRAFCIFILYFLRRWKVYGRENIPAEGGLIVVSNHVSYWDPVVVGSALTRKVFFMAKAELFTIPLLGRFIACCGAFPVYRKGSDTSAIKKALLLLRQKQVVGIFPEGTRSHSDKLLSPHVGVAMLALRSNAPVLPVAVLGTKGIFGKVRVFIGKPVKFTDTGKGKDSYHKVSAAVMREIAGLIDKRGDSG
jgi:1-acyl-sn-glycerol-3-phosphate acyltransferase